MMNDDPYKAPKAETIQSKTAGPPDALKVSIGVVLGIFYTLLVVFGIAAMMS